MNITFLNLAAQSPTLELNYSLSEKIHRDNNMHHKFFMCDSALLSCSVNIDNKTSICRICKYKAQKGFKAFKKRNENATLIKIKRKDILKNQCKVSKKTQDELQLGVDSTIASHLRLDDMSVLNKRWKKRRSNLYKSALGQYGYFSDFFKENQVSNFIIFNGRLSCSRPLITASKKFNVNYYLFDAAINGKTPMYSKNQMFHSMEFEKNSSIKTYLENFKESRSLASEYMHKKQNRINLNHDRTYTAHQEEGYINDEINILNKNIISIFTSSDDEYRFIGIDWLDYGIVDQIESIKELSKNLKDEYSLVVKMHPNQVNMHESVINKYKDLSKHVLMIKPDDKTDTYELIKKSSIIINFCSSIGIEANYLRKPVVQIGASRTMKLPSVNYVKSSNEAIKMIKNKTHKLMPIRSSIIYFTYLMKSRVDLDAYKYIRDGEVTYAGVSITAPFILRLFAIPTKAIFTLEKGHFKFIFKNIRLHISNLIFGINQAQGD